MPGNPQRLTSMRVCGRVAMAIDNMHAICYHPVILECMPEPLVIGVTNWDTCVMIAWHTFLDCMTHVSHISEVRGLYVWSSWLIRFVIHSNCVRFVETTLATRQRTLMLSQSLRILKSSWLIFFDNEIPWHMSHDRDPWVLLLTQFLIVINLCYKNNITTSKGGLEINKVLGSFTTGLYCLSKDCMYPYIHMQTDRGRERWRVCV